jgi:predicted DNA-binding transcriptional regulator YafY
MPSGDPFNKNFAKSREVIIDYTNYRGERAKRRIKPIGSMIFTHNEWHPDQQWLMLALDVERGEKRFFAMKSIHSWEAT